MYIYIISVGPLMQVDDADLSPKCYTATLGHHLEVKACCQRKLLCPRDHCRLPRCDQIAVGSLTERQKEGGRRTEGESAHVHAFMRACVHARAHVRACVAPGLLQCASFTHNSV